MEAVVVIVVEVVMDDWPEVAVSEDGGMISRPKRRSYESLVR